jgi:hypothetical protein
MPRQSFPWHTSGGVTIPDALSENEIQTPDRNDVGAQTLRDRYLHGGEEDR